MKPVGIGTYRSYIMFGIFWIVGTPICSCLLMTVQELRAALTNGCVNMPQSITCCGSCEVGMLRCYIQIGILVFYFSAIRRDIDLKFIQDTYRVDLHRSKVKVTGTVLFEGTVISQNLSHRIFVFIHTS